MTQEPYKIVPLQTEDIEQAGQVWHAVYAEYCAGLSLPAFWPNGKDAFSSYLTARIDSGNAIAAKAGGTLLGYMAWLTSDFHQDRSAFCPIVGHAARLWREETIERALYAEASGRWVRDNRYNHLMMIFERDTALRGALYDIGFGSCVMDAFGAVPANIQQTDCLFGIRKANVRDMDAIAALAKESNDYYLSPPIFLKRAAHTEETLLPLLEHGHAYTAWDGEHLIGVMSFRIEEGYDMETLTTPDCCTIGQLGVYVRAAYRGKGVATKLLAAVYAEAATLGKGTLHASYETANENAAAFWPRVFHPAIRSVRRAVNRDAG